MQLNTGNKVNFATYKSPYTVQAANERYAICVDLRHPKKMYTIVDVEQKIKATCSHYGYGVTTKDKCEEMLAALVSGIAELSWRNRAPLDITEVTT